MHFLHYCRKLFWQTLHDYNKGLSYSSFKNLFPYFLLSLRWHTPPGLTKSAKPFQLSPCLIWKTKLPILAFFFLSQQCLSSRYQNLLAVYFCVANNPKTRCLKITTIITHKSSVWPGLYKNKLCYLTGAWRSTFEMAASLDVHVSAGCQLEAQPELWARSLVLLYVGLSVGCLSFFMHSGWIPRVNIPKEQSRNTWYLYPLVSQITNHHFHYSKLRVYNWNKHSPRRVGWIYL